MLWFPRCWGTAAAGVKPLLNLMSQNANPSLPRACGQPHWCSQIHSSSLWMHVRGCKLPRGRSCFRVGCLEENRSPGKSKLDEICPSFFFLPHKSTPWESSAPLCQLGREMLNKIPNQQNENFQRNGNCIPWSAAPTLLLGLCFRNWN